MSRDEWIAELKKLYEELKSIGMYREALECLHKIGESLGHI